MNKSIALAAIIALVTIRWSAGGEEPANAPIFRIEAGMHTGPITDIATDVSGQLVLTSSRDKTARLWELPSGRLLQVLRPPLEEGPQGSLYACALSPDGSMAAVAGYLAKDKGEEKIYVFDTSTGRVVSRIRELPDTISGLAFSGNGHYLAVVGTDFGLRILATTDWKEVARDENYSASGRGVDWYREERLVTTSQGGPMRLYAFHDGSLQRLAQLEVVGNAWPRDARFSPDGRKIAAALNRNVSAEVHDGMNLTLLYSAAEYPLGGGFVDTVAWSRDGATLAATMRDSREEKRVVVWSKGGRGYALPRSIPTGGDALRLLSVRDGTFLFAGADPGADPTWGVFRADGTSKMLGTSSLADNTSVRLGPNVSFDGGVVEFDYSSEDPNGRASFSVRERQLTSSSKENPELTAPKWDLSLIKEYALGGGTGLEGSDREGKLYSAILIPPGGPSLAGPGKPHAFSRDMSHILLGTTIGLRSYTTKGQERWRVATPVAARAVNLAANDSLAVAAFEDGTIRWYDADTGAELLAFFPHADRKHWVMWATEYGAGRARIGLDLEDAEGRTRIKSVESEGAVAAGFKTGDEIVSIGGTAIPKQAALAPVLASHKPGDRVKVTIRREGTPMELECELSESTVDRPVKKVYYDASPGAEDLIGWHVNRGEGEAADFFPASRFREEFYRPDIIDRVLVTRDVAAAARQANEASGKKVAAPKDAAAAVTQKQPPIVELAVGGAAKKLDVDSGVTGVTLRYRVRKGPAGEAVTRMRVMIDGRPSLLEIPVPKDDEAVAVADVPVPGFDCSISLLADNRFASSEAAVLQIIRKKGGTANASRTASATAKPKLVLLAVGINKYLNPGAVEDLPYSVKAATDFVEVMRKQQGGLYSSVESRLLTDREATQGNIVDGFDWLRQQVGPSDIAMIFIATHGGNDSDMHYHFCAHDYDPKRELRTTVSFDEIQRIVNAVPCKIIFFLDTCHAGNALGKLSGPSGAVADVNRVVNELSSDENGAVVFAASTGRQVSWQGGKWTRGLFTQALIEGIEGKADLLGKGRITVASLETYIAARVPDLFNESIAQSPEAKKEGATAQTPTVAKPQTIPDFAIALRTGGKK